MCSFCVCTADIWLCKHIQAFKSHSLLAGLKRKSAMFLPPFLVGWPREFWVTKLICDESISVSYMISIVSLRKTPKLMFTEKKNLRCRQKFKNDFILKDRHIVPLPHS